MIAPDMAQAASTTPNIDKLDALMRAIGADASISFQVRTDAMPSEAGGFFTVTYAVASDVRSRAIGQGDTLAIALDAAHRDAIALAAKSPLAKLDRIAA